MPPPPPLGRARRRGARTGPAFDPALGDLELIATRTKLAQGRWTAARSLLAATRDDWDRRGHRLLALGDAPSAAAWAREWLLAEPGSPDATALLASASVSAALRRTEHPDQARTACLTAAGLAPEDPSPWLALLVLARSLGTEGEVVRLFDEVRARYPEHHHAHHLMAARLAERHPDAGQDPLHEVYDFASWAAEQAPADSPLAILPVVAHAERYRVLAASGSESADPLTSGHWTGRRARQVMKAAFDWWLEWEREDHPRNRVDLNFLAHAKFCEGRPAEAAALFHRIGSHATPAPWSYPDQDPHHAFQAARRAALGTV
ncbi:hypothetical protein ABZ532_23280 [Streptomyces sp. NPDC019396]|uniref:hypothetical protein n=1 Tax=Streptomyces sp. NPDC019396 TaxID=3154687 RepID=UPI0033DDA8A6